MQTDLPSHPKLQFTYKIYCLDSESPHLDFLAGKNAALALRASSYNPESFSLGYATQASFTPQDWLKRIIKLDTRIFVCVAHPSPSELEEGLNLFNGNWVGMLSQIGPMAKRRYWLTKSGSPEPRGDDLETHWHQTSTWVDPLHRRIELGTQLIEAAVAFAQAESIRAGKMQVRINAFTGPRNESSQKLYQSCGFPIVGRCSTREALELNGNSGYSFWGKTDWPDEVLDRRVRVVMEKVIELGYSNNSETSN